MGETMRSSWHLALVLALAMVARWGAGAWWTARIPPGQQFAFGDSESYWQLALAIANGKAYRYEPADALVFRAPGYPLFLSGVIQLVGPSVQGARIASALASTCAVGGVYWLGRRLFNVQVAWLAAALLAVSPEAVALGGLVLTEGLFMACAAWQIVLWTNSALAPHRRPTVAWACAAGFAGAAATLVRPSWLLFTPLGAALHIAASRPRCRPWVGNGCILAAFVMGMMPWWIRNAVVTNHFVPTTLQVGASLYDSLSPAADGSSNMDHVTRRKAQLRRSLERPHGPDAPPIEYQIDRRLAREALTWAWQHPWQTLRLAGIKLARLWNPWPNDAGLRGPVVVLAMSAWYMPVIIFGAWGLARYGVCGWPYLLCALPVAYVSVLHSIFVGSIRYRQPVWIGLVVLAAAALVAWVGSIDEKDDPRTKRTDSH